MKKILIFLSITILFFSCRKDKNTEPTGTETVHICGSVTNNPLNIQYACYWKNGVATPLTSTTATGSSAEANDMAVYNNDVYIVGAEELPSGRGTGKYWKNGILVTTFDNGTDNLVGSAIAVSANGVHIAVTQTSNAGVYTPKYWKDGTLTTLLLSGTAPNAFLTDIVTSGTDVYILGTQRVGTSRNCILWKNGSASIIPLANTSGASNFRLAVSGNDVYIVTTEYATGSSVSRIMMYKNNEAPKVITELTNAVAKDVFVSGNDLYIAGFQFNTGGTLVPHYWKNGAKTTINSISANADSELTSVYVKNTDIYACGSSVVSAIQTVTYWKNGTPALYTNGTLTSYPTKIIVQ